MFHIDGLPYLPFPGHRDSHNTLHAATSNPTDKIIILVNHNLSKSWDDCSSEPTTEFGTKTRQVNKTNISFRKSTESLSSNRSSGINGQSRPKQQLYRACNRLSKISKSTPSLPLQARLNSSSPEFQFVEDRSCAFDTSHATAVGFIPTVTTTISGGAPKSQLSQLGIARHRNIRSHQPPRKRQRQQNPTDLDVNTVTSYRPMSRSSSAANITKEEDIQTQRARDVLNFDAQSTAESRHTSRQRRIPDGTLVWKMPARKPLPSKQLCSERLAGLSPESTGQQTAANRIASLHVKKGELERRRVNLETVIYELTQAIQPDIISYDVAVKAEIKKAVLSIEKEIAEIRWEEHEIGFKVTRAWQRVAELEDLSDSSWLWAKRTAG